MNAVDFFCKSISTCDYDLDQASSKLFQLKTQIRNTVLPWIQTYFEIHKVDVSRWFEVSLMREQTLVVL